MKIEKKQAPKVIGVRLEPELWKRVVECAVKNLRSKKTQLEIIIKAGLEKLEEDERRLNKG